MSSEQIKDIVQTILEDSLNQIQVRLQNLEQKIISIEDQLNDERNKNQKYLFGLQTSVFSLESKFQDIISELNEAQTMANVIIERTEKKIIEIKKGKTTQMSQFDQLSGLNIQKNLEQMNSNLFQLAFPQQQSQQPFLSFSVQNPQKQQEEMVYKTQYGQKYHKKDCSILLKYQGFILSLKQAQKQGLTSCKICKA